MKKLTVTTIMASLLAGAVFAEDSKDCSIESTVFWENDYVLEGRKVFDYGDLLSGAIQTNWDNWTLKLWHGESTDSDYSEWNAYLSYSGSWEKMDWTLGATYFWYDDGTIENDLEIWGSGSYSLTDSISLVADVIYSTELQGFFLQLGFAHSFEWKKISFELVPLVGLDYNYVREDYDQKI